MATWVLLRLARLFRGIPHRERHAVNIHTDERRTAYYDLFPELPGQVNLYIVNPGQRTAWHRHQKQTDVFRVARGLVRFKRMRDGMLTQSSMGNPRHPFVVEPGWWHGYENIGDEPAYLLMYLDRKYDHTDEERMSEDEMPWRPA